MEPRAFISPSRWIILTAIGLAGGLAAGTSLSMPLGRLVNVTITVAVAVAVTGAVLGAFQSAGLRRVLTRPWRWIAATTIGTGLGLAAGVILVQEISILLTGTPLRVAQLGPAMRAVSFIALGAIAGTMLGAAQWLVLRSEGSAIRQWILVSAAALAAALCLASLLVDVTGLRYASAAGRFSFIILSGILFGVVTSWPLRRHEEAADRA
jgi:hypothetical protein